MKDKSNLISIIVILIFVFFIFILMLIDDGVFGENIKDLFGYIVLIASIIFVFSCIVANIYNKIKRK